MFSIRQTARKCTCGVCEQKCMTSVRWIVMKWAVLSSWHCCKQWWRAERLLPVLLSLSCFPFTLQFHFFQLFRSWKFTRHSAKLKTMSKMFYICSELHEVASSSIIQWNEWNSWIEYWMRQRNEAGKREVCLPSM